jgi:hypothetical protein
MFDHRLKLSRAFKHLKDLRRAESGWLNGDNHSVWSEPNPKTGGLIFLASVTEQPPSDPFSLLIGDFLHNLRSALDLLAFALASGHTKPLPDEVAESSEFPIFGDESKKGVHESGQRLFRDNGLARIRGWDPEAQTAVELLQPYQRGDTFREDPLWILHELDRINKHRLLHTVVAGNKGVLLDPRKSVNVAAISAGVIKSFGDPVETNTPIAEFPPLIPIDAKLEMHMEIQPALHIAFAGGTPCVSREPVLQTLYDLYAYVGGTVLSALGPFLAGPLGPNLE